MSPVPRPRRAVLLEGLLSYAILACGVLLILLVVFVAKFASLTSPSGLAQAEVARNIATGEGLTTDVIRPLGVGLAGDQADRVLFSAPLYPLVLSLPMRLFGAEDAVVALTSMAFVVLTLVLVAMVCIRLFGKRVAIGSVGLLALTVPFVQQGVTGDELAFLSLILTALFLVLILWQESPSRHSLWWTVSVAVLAAIAWLTRHEMFALIPTAIVFWLIADRRRFWRRLLWTIIPFAILAAPWVIHNVILLQRPVVSAESYALLSATTLYPEGSLVQRATPVPEHPWLQAARNPSAMYLKLRDRLITLYYRVPAIGNPFIMAVFLLGVITATARRQRALIYWIVLLAIALLGGTVALYTDNIDLITCFLPAVTVLAVLGLTETIRALDEPPVTDEPPADEEVTVPAPFTITWQGWIGVGPRGYGSGRVMSFALVLLALLATCPMVEYLFVRPPARISPMIGVMERLGEEPYGLIMTDMPSVVTWYARKRTLVLPDGPEQMSALEAAGFGPDAIYLGSRAGTSRSMFPGFEWVDRRDLPGALWRRTEQDGGNKG